VADYRMPAQEILVVVSRSGDGSRVLRSEMDRPEHGPLQIL